MKARDNITWLTVEEAAEYIRRSTKYIRDLINNGQLPVYTMGERYWLVSREELNELVIKHRRVLC